MTTVRIRATFNELPGLIAGLRGDQVPYAAALAMNDTAFQASEELRSGLRQRFKIRGTGGKSAPNSVRGPGKGRPQSSLRANKKNWPDLVAGVGILDKYLARHEEGGVQRPERKSSFAVPTAAIDAERTSSGAIPKALRPGKLIAGKHARRAKDLIINAGKASRSKIHQSIRGQPVLYLLRRRIRLPARLQGRRTLERVASARLEDNLERALAYAVRTAHPRKVSSLAIQRGL